MLATDSTGAGSVPGFTMLIPRPLQAVLETLCARERQGLLTELFRVAARVRESPSRTGASVVQLETETCMARVEWEASRGRLTLLAVRRRDPLALAP
ncbi:hypothetical protein P2318_00135 [Myxococcaceae bacterium GXIMD 01537]